MNPQNHTPIHDIIKKHQEKSISHTKEAEPFLTSLEPVHIQELIEHENLDEEVQDHVVVSKNNVEVSEELTKVGVRPITTVQFPTEKTIPLPLSDEKIIKGLHQPITSSARWLATLALYILKQAHLSLRIIHGKVVRQVRR